MRHLGRAAGQQGRMSSEGEEAHVWKNRLKLVENQFSSSHHVAAAAWLDDVRSEPGRPKQRFSHIRGCGGRFESVFGVSVYLCA